MTDLERKLAETLREQAGEVTPNLDAAWAEQQRRQQRPPRRRRTAVWAAPLAAVLVVLTSVLLATELNTAQPPPSRPAAQPGQELVLAKPLIAPTLSSPGEPKALTDFAGQTHTWTSYAYQGLDTGGRPVFCIEALPQGTTHGGTDSNFGIESPSCVPVSGSPVSAGYVGKNGGPLPEGKAVFLADWTVHVLRLYDAAGDLSQARAVAAVGGGQVFLADVKPGSPPVRFEVNPVQEVHPASR
ncbi:MULTISPECIES: hypothetical protein [Amycolatopsis]|uniref:Uncharacterized protein n=1 Tax=Amycolatopsis bullii TaxID=941987 RepID=A0ABQ3KMZ8_9PSEU|nr:hypothetical protein [Amycolatopsis bullii]GHG23054.1 hypothetical protein GCM10017567_47290 [Amycolatopsis bullii]